MKQIISSIRILAFLTVVLGLAYPVFVTLVSQVIFSKQANGSLIYQNDKLVGSELIAQKFEKPEYFWPRPSAGDYNPLPSGGTNQGSTSADLKAKVLERTESLRAAHPEAGDPPKHLLFASSSGLDPHLNIEGMEYQINRVAKARGMSAEEVKNVVESHIEHRQLGMLGEEVVNVLAVNRALDAMGGKPVPAPVEPSENATPSEGSTN